MKGDTESGAGPVGAPMSLFAQILGQVLADADGGLSTMRVVALVSSVASVGVVFGVWAAHVLTTGEYQDPSVLLGITLGASVGGKVAQRRFEQPPREDLQ